MIKKLRPLILIAVAANLLTIILYLLSGKVGSDGRFEFVYIQAPIVWIIAFITMLVIVIMRRKLFFSKSMIIWTILLMLACTPMPLLAFIEIKDWLSWELFGYQ